MFKTGFKKVVALIALPAALVLSACEIQAKVMFTPEDTATAEMTMSVNRSLVEAFASGSKADCETLMNSSQGNGIPEGAKLEDKSDSKMLRCVMRSEKPVSIKQALTDMAGTGGAQGLDIKREGDYYVINGELKGPKKAELTALKAMAGSIKFTLIFEFPGKVIDATGAKAEGNQAIIDLLDRQGEEIYIKAHAVAGGGGMGVLGWILIIGGIVVIGGGAAAVLLVRRKNKRTASQYQQAPQPHIPGGEVPAAPMPGGDVPGAPAQTPPAPIPGVGEASKPDEGKPSAPAWYESKE